MADSVDMDVERMSVAIEPQWQRFQLHNPTFSSQFCALYSKRLELLRPVISANARAKWGDNVTILAKLMESEEANSGSECVIIGTVFKDMKLRTSVLDEFRDAYSLSAPLQPVSNFTSLSDTMYVEDVSGRITVANVPAASFVCGVILGIRGHVDEMGVFQAVDFVSAMSSLPASVPASNSSGPSVIFVSGLEIGSATNVLAQQLLADTISGRNNALPTAANVVLVIIAGNSIKSQHSELLRERHLTPQQQQHLSAPSKHLDLFLSQLLGSVTVHLMPGSFDPAIDSLPQQPLAPALLPHSHRFSTLCTTPNPYHCMVDKTCILGTAGQPITDAAKYMEESTSSLNVLKSTLNWGHVAPTAPDTLNCHPFSDSDPFIIPSGLDAPQIYFTANQESFESELVQLGNNQMCRLLCVPRFATTSQAVLVNLESLHCEVLQFPID